MPTRLMIAYLLIAVMLIGGGLAVWWTIHNSDRNLRRRARREQRARYKAEMEVSDKDNSNH